MDGLTHIRTEVRIIFLIQKKRSCEIFLQAKQVETYITSATKSETLNCNENGVKLADPKTRGRIVHLPPAAKIVSLIIAMPLIVLARTSFFALLSLVKRYNANGLSLKENNIQLGMNILRFI